MHIYKKTDKLGYRLPLVRSMQRMGTVPFPGEIMWDIDIGVLFCGDGKTPGGIPMIHVPDKRDKEHILIALDSLAGNFPIFAEQEDTLEDSEFSPHDFMLKAISSSPGNLPAFASAHSDVLLDSGLPSARVALGPDKTIAGQLVTFGAPSGSGVVLEQSGLRVQDLILGASNSRAGHLVLFADETGRKFQDSGESFENVRGDITALSRHIHTADEIGAATPAYVNRQIMAITAGASPNSIKTLQELSTALSNDKNFAATVTRQLGNKAEVTHTHAVATTAAAGFMSAADKTKLEGTGPSKHVHSASDITSGMLITARLPSEIVLTTDPRLSDAREPRPHTHPTDHWSDRAAHRRRKRDADSDSNSPEPNLPPVSGPSGAIANNLAAFADATGTSLKDSGKSIGDLLRLTKSIPRIRTSSCTISFNAHHPAQLALHNQCGILDISGPLDGVDHLIFCIVDVESVVPASLSLWLNDATSEDPYKTYTIKDEERIFNIYHYQSGKAVQRYILYGRAFNLSKTQYAGYAGDVTTKSRLILVEFTG